MNATLLLIPGLLNTPRVFDRSLAEWQRAEQAHTQN
jgi:hypothetical protein